MYIHAGDGNYGEVSHGERSPEAEGAKEQARSKQRKSWVVGNERSMKKGEGV